MKPRYLLLFIVNLLAFNQGLLMNDKTKFPILRRSYGMVMEDGIWNFMEKALVDTMGVVLFGYLAHSFGRKNSLISLGIISFLFQIMYLAPLPEGFEVHMACKLINSAPLVISTIYIGETAQDCNRGVFVSSYILFNRLGQFLLSISKFWVYLFDFLQLANIVLSVVFVAAAFWLPESPIYLLLNNRTEDAKKALSHLQGNSNIDEGDVQDLIVSIEKSKSSKRRIMSFITNPATRKALIIGSVTLILNRILYTHLVLQCYFAFQEIFTLLWGYDVLSAYDILLAFSSGPFSEICGVILAVLLVDRCGRKFLLLVSCAGGAFTYVFLDIVAVCNEFPIEKNWTENYFPWLRPTLFVLSFLLYDVGCGTVPYILLSELFQTHARVSGITFCYLFYCPLTYLFYDTYGLIESSIYVAIVVIALFFTIFFCGFLFTYHCIPETKGKSLQDISEILKRQR